MRRVPDAPRRCTQLARSGSNTWQTSARSSQRAASRPDAATGSPARTPAAIITALRAPELVPTSLRMGVPARCSARVSASSAPAANAPLATAPPMTIAAPRAMPSSRPGRRDGTERSGAPSTHDMERSLRRT